MRLQSSNLLIGVSFSLLNTTEPHIELPVCPFGLNPHKMHILLVELDVHEAENVLFRMSASEHTLPVLFYSQKCKHSRGS